MKKRTILVVLSVLVVGGVAWALFRPELLFIDASVDERFPARSGDAAGAVLAEGAFHGVAHEAKGTATVHRLADGRRVLRFTGFETSNGPDLRVLAVAASDAADSDTVKQAGSVMIGKLKGNVGDQNYDLPDEVDLKTHRSVTIWCNRFGVNFATAPLAAR